MQTSCWVVGDAGDVGRAPGGGGGRGGGAGAGQAQDPPPPPPALTPERTHYTTINIDYSLLFIYPRGNKTLADTCL